MPSNVLPLHLKLTFPPIIWIFTESEGDGIESRLPFEIISTLQIREFEHVIIEPYPTAYQTSLRITILCGEFTV